MPDAHEFVFLSAKSEDYASAQMVYDFLSSRGLTVFFSHQSLPEVADADYRKQIDAALEAADHLVVVLSRAEFALTPWVEAEWGFFVTEKRSGRKPGNLLTVTTGGVRLEALPPALRVSEVIPLDPDGLETLFRYVTRSATGSSAHKETGVRLRVAWPRHLDREEQAVSAFQCSVEGNDKAVATVRWLDVKRAESRFLIPSMTPSASQIVENQRVPVSDGDADASSPLSLPLAGPSSQRCALFARPTRGLTVAVVVAGPACAGMNAAIAGIVAQHYSDAETGGYVEQLKIYGLEAPRSTAHRHELYKPRWIDHWDEGRASAAQSLG